MADEVPTTQEPQPGRRYTRYLWVIGVLIYLAIIWWLGWDRLRSALASLRLPVLAGMLTVDLAAIWLRAVKWRYVLGPDTGAVGLYYLSKAAGNFSPGRAGELLPLLLPRYRNAKMAGWVVLDRVVETMATLTAAGIGILMLNAPQFRPYLYVVGAMLLAGTAVVWGLAKPSWFDLAAQRLTPHPRLQRLAALLASASQEVLALRHKAVGILALTAVSLLLELYAATMLYAAFGLGVSLASVAVAKCAHGIVAVAPFTPSVTGVPYFATAAVMNTAANIPLDVLAVALPLKELCNTLVFWSSFGVGAPNAKQ